MLPNHQLRETARGNTDPETGICKNDIMMPHFRRRFKETLNEGRKGGHYRLASVYDCQMQTMKIDTMGYSHFYKNPDKETNTSNCDAVGQVD